MHTSILKKIKKQDVASTDDHMQYCATESRGFMDEVRIHANALEVEITEKNGLYQYIGKCCLLRNINRVRE